MLGPLARVSNKFGRSVMSNIIRKSHSDGGVPGEVSCLRKLLTLHNFILYNLLGHIWQLTAPQNLSVYENVYFFCFYQSTTAYMFRLFCFSSMSTKLLPILFQLGTVVVLASATLESINRLSTSQAKYLLEQVGRYLLTISFILRSSLPCDYLDAHQVLMSLRISTNLHTTSINYVALKFRKI